jgi:hypothetical protein
VQLQSIEGAGELSTKTPDGRDLVFLTGTATLFYGGTGPTFIHDDLVFPIGPIWEAVHDVAPMAALASIYNDHVANNAGWATDRCTFSVANNQIYLHVGLAVSDSDGVLYRVAFQATAIGILPRN